MSQVPNDGLVFGTIGGASLWDLVQKLIEHAPSWALVPPILLSAASCLAAVRAYRNDREKWLDAEQDRLYRAELHQLKIAAQFKPQVETLGPRS